ncbi:MAG: sigma-70 family RNA polymerase sigma factor [Lysobacterales bacterium]
MNRFDMRQELVNLGSGAHALAIQILGNADDAADAVHDAFERVLSRPGAYERRRGPLKPWFLRVVRNRCIDLLRQRRTNEQPVDELASAGRTPEQETEQLQRDLSLQRSLAQLEPDHRQIVVLRDYLDLSYAEIADVLGIATGTVMSRLHRARLALKEVLERHDA